MPLFVESILRAKGQSVSRMATKSAGSILLEGAEHFSKAGYDVFLSHSYADKEVILGLREAIQEKGFAVYVDWIDDKQLDRTQVTKSTAQRLREKMGSCKSLFFAVSDNSPRSVWMPWELGYFDGIKGKVAILPIQASGIVTEEYKGQEYLGLYPYVVDGTLTLWIHNSASDYSTLGNWLASPPPARSLSMAW